MLQGGRGRCRGAIMDNFELETYLTDFFDARIIGGIALLRELCGG